jgi:hypothetical protein
LVESENLTLIKAMVGLSPADAASALNIDATEDVFDHMALMDDTEIAFDAARAVDVVAQSAFCAAFVRCAENGLRAVYEYVRCASRCACRAGVDVFKNTV